MRGAPSRRVRWGCRHSWRTERRRRGVQWPCGGTCPRTRGWCLTWRRSLARWGRHCGYRPPAAHSLSRALPRRRAAAAGTAASLCPSRCRPCQAAAACWSCCPRGPWGCRKPGRGGAACQAGRSCARLWGGPRGRGQGCCGYLALGGVADTPDGGYHGEGSCRLIGAWLPRNSLVCK